MKGSGDIQQEQVGDAAVNAGLHSDYSLFLFIPFCLFFPVIVFLLLYLCCGACTDKNRGKVERKTMVQR